MPNPTPRLTRAEVKRRIAAFDEYAEPSIQQEYMKLLTTAYTELLVAWKALAAIEAELLNEDAFEWCDEYSYTYLVESGPNVNARTDCVERSVLLCAALPEDYDA